MLKCLHCQTLYYIYMESVYLTWISNIIPRFMSMYTLIATHKLYIIFEMLPS